MSVTPPILPGGRFRFRSLNAKLALLLAVVTAVSLAGMAVLHLDRSRAREEAAALRYLGLAAERHAESIARALDDMERDGEILAEMPAVAELVSIEGAADPVGGDRAERAAEASDRLGRKFESFLANRPEYTQVRLIGRSDDWRERVRVNQPVPGTIRHVPGAELQSKAGEPYLVPLDRGPPPEVYFSDVTANRERGRVDGPETLRLVHPVFDGEGRLFGALVINAGFHALLERAAPRVMPGMAVTAVTGSGLRVAFGAGGVAGAPDRDVDGRTPAETASAGSLLVGVETARVRHVIQQPTELRPFAMHVVTEVPRSELFAASARHFRQDVLLAVALTLLAVLAGLAAGRRLMRPLTALHAVVTTPRPHGTPLRLRKVYDDDIGDITEAVVAMANDLVAETGKLRAVFAGAAKAILVIDEAGRIEDANPAALTLFGRRQGDLAGRCLRDLMPPDSARDLGAAVADLRGGRSLTEIADSTVVHADGRRVPVEISASLVPRTAGLRVVAILRDMTERRAEERRRAELLLALQRSNDELDDFAYVASHDLKAPLRVIANAATWLSEDLAPHLTDDTRETLDLMKSRVRRMERLLDDLLAHSRIGAADARAPLVPGRRLAEEVLGLVTCPAGFTVDVSAAFDRIELPLMPLKMILTNLVGNAIGHHDRDAGLVRLDVETHPNGFVFTVADDGPGIHPDYHDKVFEMFRTLRPRDHVEASGMGLAMVRKQVGLVGGHIEVRSDGERGTVFRLFWPTVPPVPTAPAAPERIAS